MYLLSGEGSRFDSGFLHNTAHLPMSSPFALPTLLLFVGNTSLTSNPAERLEVSTLKRRKLVDWIRSSEVRLPACVGNNFSTTSTWNGRLKSIQVIRPDELPIIAVHNLRCLRRRRTGRSQPSMPAPGGADEEPEDMADVLGTNCDKRYLDQGRI